jgi:SAM-dependent methyltransferase
MRRDDADARPTRVRAPLVSPDDLYARAVDPRQYDSAGLDWGREGVPSTPSIRFLRRTLDREMPRLDGRSVLDIGCGTGHLATLFQAKGAARMVGIEPSSRNVAIARRDHPTLEVIESTLERAELERRFDVAVAVMSFEHVPVLPAAFRRVNEWLEPGGAFFLITTDREFQLRPRFGATVESRDLDGDLTVVATHYAYGTIHDLLRDPSAYQREARRAGFVIQRRAALLPGIELIVADPDWAAFAHRPVAHLVVLRKTAHRA